MGQISDDRLLKIERVRSAIISFLKRIGYEVEDEADFEELLPIINGVDKNALLRSFLDGTFVGEYIDDEITTLRGGAFSYIYGLAKIEIPRVTYLPGAFANNIYLNTFFVSNATSFGGQAMCYFGSKKGVILRKWLWANTYQNGISYNYSTPVLDLQFKGVSTTAPTTDQCIIYGTGLSTVILRSNGVCRIGSVSTIRSNIQEIYVPQSLINEYLTATNWSAVENIANRLKPIEGSKYESLTWYEEEENQNGSN